MVVKFRCGALISDGGHTKLCEQSSRRWFETAEGLWYTSVVNTLWRLLIFDLGPDEYKQHQDPGPGFAIRFVAGVQ